MAIRQVSKAYLSSFFVFRESKKSTRKLIHELKQLEQPPSLFNQVLIKRVEFYILQALVCAEWTCTLRGEKITDEEKKQAVYLGAATPLIDDLIDDSGMKSSEIIKWLEDSELRGNETNETIIISYLYKKLKSVQSSTFHEVMQEALAAQDNSLKQLQEKKLNDDELKTLTAAKGGLATLLYRSVLNSPLKKGEKEAFIALGYVLQQTNDLFDLYKDSQNRQQTQFTNSNDLFKNKEEFDRSIETMVNRFQHLTYKEAAIEQCLLKISVVTSRAFVCFRQLLSLQKKPSIGFDVSNYTREQLICDMEKPFNLYQSFQYSLAFYSSIKISDKNA